MLQSKLSIFELSSYLLFVITLYLGNCPYAVHFTMSSWWQIDWNKYFQGSNNCMHNVSESFTLEPWPIGIFMLIWSQIQCFSKCTIFQCVSNHRFSDLCDKKKLLLMYWNFHACLLKSSMLCPLSVHLAACQSIYFHLILAHTVMDTLEILCLSRSATVDTTMLAHVFKLINKYIYIYKYGQAKD